MNDVNFTIRKATIDDINRLTDLHCKSFKPEDHVPMMLGENYVKATYKWQVLSKNAYVLVAEFEDKLAGLVAVCDGAFTKAMFFACLPEFILGIVKNPKLLLKKMLWKRLFRQPKITEEIKALVDSKGFAQMTIGAVEKEYRGSGVFGELINATKEYSKKRGSNAIRAGVYKKNQSSRRVFIKSGWPEITQLETIDTVFYVAFFDKSVALAFGVVLEQKIVGNITN
jgi:GNAT superfamily N-acetyltransferase